MSAAKSVDGEKRNDRRSASGTSPGGRQGDSGHVCPWWVGYLLVNPLRRLVENPKKILGAHVRLGMTVFEPGCGMGFFTLDLARMVGPGGKVICVDLQEKMIAGLLRRARKAGVENRIEASVCGRDDLGEVKALRSGVDFVPAIHVVHEIADRARFFRQVAELLKNGGRMLILEPRGHVSEGAFRRTLDLARDAGLADLPPPALRRDRAALLQKTAP